MFELSADLFPLMLSSAEIWTSDKKYKEDVSLKGAPLSRRFSNFFFYSLSVTDVFKFLIQQ